MKPNCTDQTLAQQMRINDADLAQRKDMLGLTPELEEMLGGFNDAIRECVDAVVDDFYLQQVQLPQVQQIVGDADTLRRLKASMRGYVIGLFSGRYDADYVNSRLRIGKVHARIGVPPRVYVSSMHRLENHVTTVLAESYGYDADSGALQKLMLFDLQLVFDTYIQGLVSEVELARDEVIRYSESLEANVAERTAEIARLAQVDDLTGLLNRRHFMDQAQGLLERCERRAKPLSLVFLDLDGFKHVNDTQGHQEGDRALATVGGIVQDVLEKGDLAARYGGDEFCVLLPGSDTQGAKTFCDNLAKALDNHSENRLAASFGVATAEPGSMTDLPELIAIADGAMYANRQSEREQVPVTFMRSAES